MALTITSGGSLTTAMLLTMVAWGIRALRGAALRGIFEDKRGFFQFNLSNVLNYRRGRKVVSITHDAFKLLVQEKPVPFAVFNVYREEKEKGEERDMRSNSIIEALSSTDSFSALGQVNCLPEYLFKEILARSVSPASLPSAGTRSISNSSSSTSMKNFNSHYSSAHIKLTKNDLVVIFNGGDEKQARQLAAFTCDLGYTCVYVKGKAGPSNSDEFVLDARVESISKNAIMYLISLKEYVQAQQRVGNARKQDLRLAKTHIYDVRRHDELSLYGQINGSEHLPATELPHAFALSNEEWLKKYRFKKPEQDDVIVVLCNSGLRSRWVARLFIDNGYKKTLYDSNGTNSWHIDHSLSDYSDYTFGGILPEPKTFALQEAHIDQGKVELETNGILPYLKRKDFALD